MPPWMKRRIERVRARCQKTTPSHKQKAERTETEKQVKKPSKTRASSR